MIRLNHVLPPDYPRKLGILARYDEISRVAISPEVLQFVHAILKDAVTPKPYAVPGFFGYYRYQNEPWVWDGRIQFAYKDPDEAFRFLSDILWGMHFKHLGACPFVSLDRQHPTHILLHDLSNGSLFLDTFEQGEAFLHYQWKKLSRHG